MATIVTAGHIDHGKSTLVEALTGQNPDRLAEEKSRGLTIDLGFAWTALDSGKEVAFVDVPGHQKFVGNMLAGAGSVSACLFVVSAQEKMKPQSWEHLHIMEFFGVKSGVVALTKSAGFSDSEFAAVELEVRTALKTSFLKSAKLVRVDAVAKMGLDDLRSALNELVEGLGQPPDLARPRLWVDRSFSASGAGTIVTGTLTYGEIALGDDLEIFSPKAQNPRQVKVRGIQSLEKAQERVLPDTRTALNLAGIGKEEIGRGDVLVKKGDWFASKVFDASLKVPPSAFKIPTRISRRMRGSYMVYLGSGDFMARIAIVGSSAKLIEAGEPGVIRIFLETALPLKIGDHYVLRDLGRNQTLGGGEILDLDPVLRVSAANPDMSVERIINERGGYIKTKDLELLTLSDFLEPALEAKTIVQLGEWSFSQTWLHKMQTQLQQKIQENGELGLAVSDLSKPELEVLKTLDNFRIEHGKAYLGIASASFSHPYLELLEQNLFSPPGPEGHIEKNVLRDLVQRQALIMADGIFFSNKAIADAKQVLARLLDQNPQGITVSQVRVELGTSRKYVLALLGHFDETGVTKRREDLRLAGPRL